MPDVDALNTSLIELTQDSLNTAFIGLGCGILLGILIHFLFSRPRQHRLEIQNLELNARIEAEEKTAAARETALQQAEERLTATMGKLANESLEKNSSHFLRLAEETLGKHQERAKATLTEREKAVADLVKPIRDALDLTHKQIGEIEKSRHESFGSIKAQLESMTAGQEGLRNETQKLSRALRRPEVRGRWGELTLRRVVELAGMMEHCDFTEQESITTEKGVMRPDMVIRLAEGGELVVDVKTPLDAYLDATEAEDDETRKSALQRHERNVRNRVQELATKAYWNQFTSSPDFVVLFIPGDHFLSAALTENPNLYEEALRQKIILATPSTLMALLRTFAYGWRQLALAENAEEIRRLAEDLYGRLTVFTGHVTKIGQQLDASVKTYNNAVGSLKQKVLPGARKFTELGIRPKKQIESPPEIETVVRQADNLPGFGLPDDSQADESMSGSVPNDEQNAEY
jgi:DNA recombination protein RmuC